MLNNSDQTPKAPVGFNDHVLFHLDLVYVSTTRLSSLFCQISSDEVELKWRAKAVFSSLFWWLNLKMWLSNYIIKNVSQRWGLVFTILRVIYFPKYAKSICWSVLNNKCTRLATRWSYLLKAVPNAGSVAGRQTVDVMQLKRLHRLH